MKQSILYMLILISLVACAFPRDNPVDPENTGTPAPRKVTNLNARGYSNPKRVELTWNSIPSDGYIVYRAGYYNGDYRAIEELSEGEYDSESPTYIDNDIGLIAGKTYYYRVSAYLIIDNDLLLEGEQSDYSQVNVPSKNDGS